MHLENALCWDRAAFGFEAGGPALSCLAKPRELLRSYSQQIRLLLGFLVGSWMEPAAEPVYTFEYTSPISLIPSNPQHPSLKDLANGMSSWCPSQRCSGTQVSPQHTAGALAAGQMFKEGGEASPAGIENTHSVSLTNKLGARNNPGSNWLTSFSPAS